MSSRVWVDIPALAAKIVLPKLSIYPAFADSTGPDNRQSHSEARAPLIFT
jgi:hypothetical protein